MKRKDVWYTYFLIFMLMIMTAACGSSDKTTMQVEEGAAPGAELETEGETRPESQETRPDSIPEPTNTPEPTTPSPLFGTISGTVLGDDGRTLLDSNDQKEIIMALFCPTGNPDVECLNESFWDVKIDDLVDSICEEGDDNPDCLLHIGQGAAYVKPDGTYVISKVPPGDYGVALIWPGLTLYMVDREVNPVQVGESSTAHFKMEFHTPSQQELSQLEAGQTQPGSVIEESSQLEESPTEIPVPEPTEEPEEDLQLQPEPVTEDSNADGHQRMLVANPECLQPVITTADEITVRVRWGATSPTLAESNANHFTFRFYLDGQEFDDIRPFRQTAEYYSGQEEYGCGAIEPLGWVHWDVPLGQLPSGFHTIAVEHILDEPISDGFDNYPAGSLGLVETSFEVLPMP